MLILKEKGNQILKPYWNDELTVLKRMVSDKYKSWLKEGPPRGRNYKSFCEYKEAKRKLRKEQRRCVKDFRLKEIEEIAKANELDYERFWRLINSRKCCKCSAPILELENEICVDPQDIAEKWADYFENLYTPAEDGESTREVMAIAKCRTVCKLFAGITTT